MESTVRGLKAPTNVTINIKPSPKQWELWNLLQPNCCPHCGGEIEQAVVGQTRDGRNSYRPRCKKCGNRKLPQLILGGGAAGGGKAGLLDSQVLTPFGYRKLRDIKVGDSITSPTTGGIQKVVYLHPIGEFDFYRVKFRDGTYFDCSEGHLWQLHQSRKGKSKKAAEYGTSVDEVWPTVKMYEWYRKKKQGMYEGQNLIIPLTEPVRFTFGDKGNHYIDPYILGAIIGDGCITNSVVNSGYVQFTTMDQEIVDRFTACGYDMSCRNLHSEQAYAYNIKDKELIECLKKHGMAGNCSQTHYIPKVYKFGTIEDRIKLMQGLMDTDGYVDERGHMSYTSTSKQLAEDVAFVVRSLGGVATITTDMGSYKDNSGVKHACSQVWTVCFRTKMDPDLCGLTRKKSRAKYEFNGDVSEYGKQIIDVEHLGKKEGRCISVSEPQGLYVVDNFTVTHNSWLGSNWICSLCIRFPDIRCVVARKTIKSLKESTFNTVRSVLKDWGLIEGTHFKINNLENWLQFWNGSIIYLKELETTPADPNFERLGSTEITAAFVDEVSEISERAIEVLMSRCRWKVADYMGYPRVLMTTNPCATWVRSRFVQDDDGNPAALADTDAFVRFSVYDNPCDDFVKVYENNLKNIKDPATRERLLYGNWDFVDTNEAAAYWQFDGSKHLVSELREQVYNPLNPIILSFDFNVMPYMSCLVFQIDYNRKKVYVIEEILGKPEDKENNTPKFAKKIRDKYLNEQHTGGLFITGDPAGLSRSTQTEEGENNYTIIENTLQAGRLKATRKLLKKQPPQMTRLEFINSVLGGYDGWECQIDLRCRRFTEDLIYQKKNPDGTKSKAKVQDPKLGVKYERYGHLSDCFDYFICMFLSDSWKHYQARNSGIATTGGPIYGAFYEY